MRVSTKWLVSAAAGLMSMAAISSAQAQLYAADNLTDNSLHGVVTFNGNLTTTGSFLSNGAIAGLATNGTSIFASLPTGITQYTTAGTVVRSYANLGTDSFGALAFTGTTLLAADNLTDNSLYGVVLFNSTLQSIGSFLTPTAISGLATDGTNVYTSLTSGVNKYSMTGTLLTSYANLGTDSFGALSFANGVLYAADNLTDNSLNGIVKFNTSLTTMGSFLTTGFIAGVAADGTNVYTSLPTGISEYTNNGVLVRTYANLGTDKFGALALTPAVSAAVPEPGTWALMLVGFAGAGFAMRRRPARLAAAAA